jgi:hypothetical protein
MRLSAEYVDGLTARMQQARQRIQDRAEEQMARRTWPPSNIWVAATGFLDAFEHLRRAEGFRLACVCEASLDERSSQMVWVRSRSAELPAIPEALKAMDFGFSFTRSTPDMPAGLPEWVQWDVSRVLKKL